MRQKRRSSALMCARVNACCRSDDAAMHSDAVSIIMRALRCSLTPARDAAATCHMFHMPFTSYAVTPLLPIGMTCACRHYFLLLLILFLPAPPAPPPCYAPRHMLAAALIFAICSSLHLYATSLIAFDVTPFRQRRFFASRWRADVTDL